MQNKKHDQSNPQQQSLIKKYAYKKCNFNDKKLAKPKLKIDSVNKNKKTKRDEIENEELNYRKVNKFFFCQIF